MCGEAAADPMLIPLLISFGLDEFSVSPTSVLKTRKELSRWTVAEADKITAGALALDTADEVKAFLETAIAG